MSGQQYADALMRHGAVSKAEVYYTDDGSDREHCGICRHFLGPHGCEIVAGRVVAGGWCSRFRALERAA